MKTMCLLKTGELVFKKSGYSEDEILKEVVVNYDSDYYIFLEVDLGVVTIAKLFDISSSDAVTPFEPEDSGSAHRMFELSDENISKALMELKIVSR